MCSICYFGSALATTKVFGFLAWLHVCVQLYSYLFTTLLESLHQSFFLQLESRAWAHALCSNHLLHFRYTCSVQVCVAH